MEKETKDFSCICGEDFPYVDTDLDKKMGCFLVITIGIIIALVGFGIYAGIRWL